MEFTLVEEPHGPISRPWKGTITINFNETGAVAERPDSNSFHNGSFRIMGTIHVHDRIMTQAGVVRWTRSNGDRIYGTVEGEGENDVGSIGTVKYWTIQENVPMKIYMNRGRAYLFVILTICFYSSCDSPIEKYNPQNQDEKAIVSVLIQQCRNIFQ